MAAFTAATAAASPPPAPAPVPAPAPPGPVPEPRVGNPERYAGDPEGCNPFITNCSILYALQPQTFSSEEAKVAFAINHLTGRARSGFDGDCRVGAADSSLRVSFQAFATELRKGNHRTVQDYAIDFRTKARLSDWNEPARCDAFLRGLGEYLKDELVSYELPSSFDDLVGLTTRVSTGAFRLAVRRDVRFKDTSPPRFDPWPPSATEEATSNSSNSHTREPESEPMQIGRTRLSPEERARRRQGNLCLYCGQAGHFISRCPAKGRTHQ
ncbi:hypothetical protein L3Q82_025292 [Scortum barcoo]|uniref:Uncharacterized protein n=1 Tax=Scortum barcoo TaxID=214431 RepID=A0ACB8WRR8_9TELE|nr:hypothetical protein L3Q82_025292 [Scortum barcoo]